jgi:Tfp pilus assembly protein PilV
MDSSRNKNNSGKSNNAQESGIVLLDVLFALFVMAIAAIYLIESRSSSIRRSASTHSLRIARMLAGKKMEEVLTDNMATEPDQNFSMSGDFKDDGYHGYEFEIEEEEVLVSSEEDLEDEEKREWYVRRLTVTVTYPGEGVKEQTFSLTTILPEILEEESGG